MKENTAFVGNTGQRDRLGWLRGFGRYETRHHQVSEDCPVFPVGHGVIVPVSGLQETDLDEKVVRCTFLHSVPNSLSWLRDVLIIQVSR